MPEAKIKTAAYYRCSDPRQERSVPEQARDLERWAPGAGLDLVARFEDEESGDKTEKRVGFLALIAAAVRGDFQAIAVWDWNRLGRFSPFEAGHYLYPLIKAGVRLFVFQKGEVQWEDNRAQVFAAFEAAGANEDNVKRSAAVTRGVKASAEAGHWPGGPPPYAYVLVEDKDAPPNKAGIRPKLLALDPEHPEREGHVKELFERYAAGELSVYGLVCDFNERGIPSPSAARPPELKTPRKDGSRDRRPASAWNVQSVLNILACPHYTGRLVWNRRTDGLYYGVNNGSIARKDAGEKGVVKLNDPSDWVWGKGGEQTHPEIVSPELYEIVRKRLEERSVRKRKEGARAWGDRHIFSGLVRCAVCDRHLRDLAGKKCTEL
jgi:DNA invertase Pin-like site-specific DNA recombinase